MVTIVDSLQLKCGQIIKNRVVKAATTEGLADDQNRVTDRLITLYRRWAKSEAGLLITGNVQIDHSCLERAGNVVIEGVQSKLQMEKLTAWAQAGKSCGGQIWMQISHAGRQTPIAINKQPFAPSEVQLQLMKNFGIPRALTVDQISDYINRFAHAAVVARDAGFSGVQIHAAHGYLISEFLSPHTNTRTDQWGGSLENRARFLLSIITAVRNAVGYDYPISVKLNSADFQRGGFLEDEALMVAKWLDASKIDMLEISGGTYEQPMMAFNIIKANTIKRKESTIAREAFFLVYAEQIRKVTSIPLMVTGGFRTAAFMNKALASHALDLIGIARPFCVDPDCTDKLLKGATHIDSVEQKNLRLGPGRLLGMESPIGIIRNINAFGQLSWCYEQIFRMADGREPDPTMGLLKAFVAQNIDEVKKTKQLMKKVG